MEYGMLIHTTLADLVDIAGDFLVSLQFLSSLDESSQKVALQWPFEWTLQSSRLQPQFMGCFHNDVEISASDSIFHRIEEIPIDMYDEPQAPVHVAIHYKAYEGRLQVSLTHPISKVSFHSFFTLDLRTRLSGHAAFLKWTFGDLKVRLSNMSFSYGKHSLCSCYFHE
jgi:hypothetical protein